MDDLAKQHNIVRASKLNKEGASASGIESSLNMVRFMYLTYLLENLPRSFEME